MGLNLNQARTQNVRAFHVGGTYGTACVSLEFQPGETMANEQIPRIVTITAASDSLVAVLKMLAKAVEEEQRAHEREARRIDKGLGL